MARASRRRRRRARRSSSSWSRSPSAAAGTRWNAATTWASGAAAWTAAAIEPSGDDGDELAAVLLQAVRHRDHGLAGELVGVVGGGGDGGVPHRGEHDEVGLGGVVVGPGSRVATRSPHCARSSSTTLRPGRGRAIPRSRRGPTLASRTAIPRPAGPSPPTPRSSSRELRTRPRATPTHPPARPVEPRRPNIRQSSVVCGGRVTGDRSDRRTSFPRRDLDADRRRSHGRQHGLVTTAQACSAFDRDQLDRLHSDGPARSRCAAASTGSRERPRPGTVPDGCVPAPAGFVARRSAPRPRSGTWRASRSTSSRSPSPVRRARASKASSCTRARWRGRDTSAIRRTDPVDVDGAHALRPHAQSSSPGWSSGLSTKHCAGSS